MSRKVVAFIASILGLGTGAAIDDKVVDLVANHGHEFLPSQREVVAPQCNITVRVDERFINDYCETLK